MSKIAAAVVAVVLLAGAPALACNDPAHINALRDQARAAEKQAESLRQIERQQREQTKLLDRAQRNAR